MNSRNVVLTGPRQAVVRDEPLPAVGPDRILVKSLVSHVSIGTESWCYLGDFDADTGWSAWVKYPFYPGYSVVGTVMETGEKVTGVKVGDRVVTSGSHRQYEVRKYDPRQVIKLPEWASADDASWASLSVITQGAVRRAGHAMGEAAAVIGLGPLGQLIVQYLRTVGLRAVLAIDVAPARLELAARLGATATWCGDAREVKPWIEEQLDGELPDVVYDVTGNFRVLPVALGLARRFGTVMLAGDTPYPSRQHLTHDVLTREVSIVGVHSDSLPPAMGFWTRPRQIQLFLDYIHRGLMNVTELTTRRVTVDELPALYEELQTRRGDHLGILVDWPQ